MAPTPDPVTQSDAELALRLSRGEQAAFAALYQRYARPVHDFVARIVRDPAMAEDVTQTTFVQAWERRRTLRSPEAVKRWIYQMAHNFALNQVTRRPATVAMEEDLQLAAVEPGPEESAVNADAARLVWDAAASLEPRQLAVLDLSVRCGLTSSEIAEILEVDTARASLLVTRAKEALGNAVRYLLVARRRSHCERLMELVPAGVSQLSPEQRATVDHHMRRCPVCQGMALRLTAPEELFGALLLLPMPRQLTTPPQVALTAAHLGAALPAAPAAPPPVPGSGLRMPRHVSASQAAIAAVAAAALIAGVAFGIGRITTSSGADTGAQIAGSSPTTPAVSGSPTPAVTAEATAPAGSQLTWSAPTTIATTSALWSISCPTSTVCAAVDLGGNVVTYDGASWSAVTAIDDSNAASYDDDGSSAHISCPTTTFCAAIENGGDVITYDGESWSAPEYVDPDTGGISCVSNTFCVAVDGNGDAMTYDGASWSATTSVDPDAGLNSVSCASSSFCVAVDEDGNAVTYDGGSWAAPISIDPGVSLLSVSCPSSSFCAAVDWDGAALTYSGGSWSRPTSLDPGTHFPSVSCATSSVCVAVTTDGDVDTYDGASWSTPVSIETPAPGGPVSVSCPSTTFCAMVDMSHRVLVAK